jgi:hypothetical protein
MIKFIYKKQHALSDNICEEIINIYNKYNNNNNPIILNVKHNNHEYVSNIINVLKNESTEYFKSIYSDKNFPYVSLNNSCQTQLLYTNETCLITPDYLTKQLSINNILIEKQQQKKNNKTDYNNSYKYFYKDKMNNVEKRAILKYIFFLNNVDYGGEVIILNNKIIPEKGLLLIVPTEWFFNIFETMTLSNDKYIIHGCIYYDI